MLQGNRGWCVMKRLEWLSEETTKRVWTLHMGEEEKWKRRERSSNGDRIGWVRTNCMVA